MNYKDAYRTIIATSQHRKFSHLGPLSKMIAQAKFAEIPRALSQGHLGPPTSTPQPSLNHSRSEICLERQMAAGSGSAIGSSTCVAPSPPIVTTTAQGYGGGSVKSPLLSSSMAGFVGAGGGGWNPIMSARSSLSSPPPFESLFASSGAGSSTTSAAALVNTLATKNSNKNDEFPIESDHVQNYISSPKQQQSTTATANLLAQTRHFTPQSLADNKSCENNKDVVFTTQASVVSGNGGGKSTGSSQITSPCSVTSNTITTPNNIEAKIPDVCPTLEKKSPQLTAATVSKHFTAGLTGGEHMSPKLATQS